jgi:hypothetical protein
VPQRCRSWYEATSAGARAGRVVGLHIDFALPGRPVFLFRRQLELERRNDLLGEFVLNGEDVSEVAIEAIGPDMRTALSVDELAGNADPVARLPHAAFQYIAHAEIAANLLHVDRLAPCR